MFSSISSVPIIVFGVVLMVGSCVGRGLNVGTCDGLGRGRIGSSITSSDSVISSSIGFCVVPN
jgi:hypothetical protein